MKFGYFDDVHKEYVIETPATPLPWINYLGNDGFFGLISNTAGGYHFYKDAKLRRITRYRYNNVPADQGGRCYYIKDGDTIWSPSFLPAKTRLDEYQCRHGLGYSSFHGAKNQISVDMTFLVPLNKNCELNRLVIKNHSSEEKKLQLYSALEWCLWNAVDDSTNFQRNLSTGEVEIEGSTIYHKTEYRERRNHYAFFTVNSKVDGFDSDRDTFLGTFHGFDSPSMVEQGRSGNSIASGWSPMAGHRIDLVLKPGEERSFLFQLGYCQLEEEDKWEAPGIINKKPALALMEDFQTDEDFLQAKDALKTYWDDLLSHYHVQSSNQHINRMVNIWNQYQCMVTFNMSRSASYYESGTGRGMGFRDSCQDLLGFVHMIPDRARERIIDIASIQFEDGSTYHQYQPLTKRGNADIGSGFNDDPLWLVACTCAYIRESGDLSILEVPTPYNNDESKAQPLIDHLRKSLHYTIHNKGPHGLPLIGRADWNDCLNLNCFSKEPGESFQTASNFESGKAESVFIAGMFVKYAEDYAALCDYLAKHWQKDTFAKEALELREEIEKMTQAVLNYGWDGEWFLRAYDAYENKVGSKECQEGKIYIEPQGFCVLAGIGIKEGYAQQAMESVKKYLTNDYGIEILWPCYTKYHLELGEISSYPPGYKENGAIFCHNNPWIVAANARAGRPEDAYAAYMRTCPSNLESISEIHRTEPYVYSQMIAGRSAPNYGEAKNSWLTGTAAWTFLSISQELLGIRPDYMGLRIHPCLPKDFGDFTITRLYRGVVYHIHFHGNSEEKYLVVNNKQITSDLLPLPSDPSIKEVTVEVYC